MLYSNQRKLALSGWLQKHNNAAYSSPLRLQKFLFFYEVFAKVEDDEPDFNRMRGYKRGPVFSNVWGDYTKDRYQFNVQSLASYCSNPQLIDVRRAMRASFIVSSLTEKELSQLTHRFNIWNSKAPRIMAGEQQVDLYEADFSNEDNSLVRMLEAMYPDSLVNNSIVLSIGEKNFVLSVNDQIKFTEQHMDTIAMLAERADLHNPVFIEIDENGGLLVD